MHDLQNAAAWAVAPFVQDKMMDDVFICMESLRNGYRLLQMHLMGWLQTSIHFVEDGFIDKQGLLQFYNAMDVDPSLADMLTMCLIMVAFVSGMIG